MRHSLRWLLAATFLLALGCSKQADNPQATKDLSSSLAAREKIKAIDHVAWLSRELPPETIGYFRLPLLWDVLAQPDGDALSNLKASAAHQQQLAAIRQGLMDNLWSKLPAPAAAPAALLFELLASPMEVAATLPPDGSLVPNFLIGASLKLKAGQSFDEMLSELLETHPQVRLLSPTDAEGISTVLAGPLPVYVHFDQNSSRMRLFTGASATIQYFRQQIKAQPSDNPVALWEKSRDSSGRGMSLWMDLERLWPQVSPMVPEKNRQLLEALGVNQIKALHAASVARDGHGQLLLDLQMPEEGFRKLLPRPNAPINIKSSDSPDLLVRLALPSEQEVQQALDQIRSTLPDPTEFDQGLKEVSDAIVEAVGTDPGLLLRAFGPQLLYVVDQAGTWTGYQIRDEAARQQLESVLSEITGSELETRSVGGKTYSHWKWAASFEMPGDDQSDDEASGALGLALEVIERIKTHVFWVNQPGHLISASVPQVLMARERLGADYDLGQWLQQAVGVNPDNSVVLIARRHERGAKGLYYFYLQALLMLADLAEVTIDPFELPIWQDVAPGDPGGIAMGLDSTAEGLTAHLTYQMSPLETLQGAETFVMVYFVGITAAIAIPAYKDFELRSQVGIALAAGAPYKLLISEHVMSEGGFPASLDDFELPEPSANISVSYDPESGELTLTFDETAPAKLAFGDLRFLPSIDEDGLVDWQCYSDTIEEKLLPGSCIW